MGGIFNFFFAIIENVVNTTTYRHTPGQVIYIKGTRQFAINGTNFSPKRTELIFEPPLIRNQARGCVIIF